MTEEHFGQVEGVQISVESVLAGRDGVLLWFEATFKACNMTFRVTETPAALLTQAGVSRQCSCFGYSAELLL